MLLLSSLSQAAIFFIFFFDKFEIEKCLSVLVIRIWPLDGCQALDKIQ